MKIGCLGFRSRLGRALFSLHVAHVYFLFLFCCYHHIGDKGKRQGDEDDANEFLVFLAIAPQSQPLVKCSLSFPVKNNELTENFFFLSFHCLHRSQVKKNYLGSRGGV